MGAQARTIGRTVGEAIDTMGQGATYQDVLDAPPGMVAEVLAGTLHTQPRPAMRRTMPDYPDAAYCTVAPDWACEVLSPSTLRVDRHEKSGIYAREGVSHLWLVDPDARTLEALELRDGRWALLATLADGDPVSLPPFDAITFPLDALWPESAAWDGDA